MKYCKNCNLKFDGKQDTCIFCGNTLEVINDKCSSSFPVLKPQHYYIDKTKRILLFSFIAAFAISVLLCVYLFKDRPYYILTGFSLIYAYFVFSLIVDNSKGIVGKIQNISMLTTFETLGVFLFFEELQVFNIYFTYVYPGAIVLTLIAIGIVLFVFQGKRIHDQLIYFLINILWGLTPLIFIILNKVEPTWPSSTCVLISLLTLLAFIFFADKESKDEFIRRFHV